MSVVGKYGPQTAAIETLLERAAKLTDNEIHQLHTAGLPSYAARNAAWDAARNAASFASSSAVLDAALDAAYTATRYSAWDAVSALVVRNLIGQHGFAQKHYGALTRPWVTVIGPAHPDDV